VAPSDADHVSDTLTTVGEALNNIAENIAPEDGSVEVGDVAMPARSPAIGPA